MATLKNPVEDPHFNRIFYFLVSMAFTSMVYIFLITFLKIPQENLRFADTTQGFLLGTVVGGAMLYFTGGSPAPIKTSGMNSANTTTTTDIHSTITESPQPISEQAEKKPE